jgi:predicted TIM-barrel fold metal-dependent hydrolase
MPLSLHILTARGGTGADQRAGRNFLLSLANLHHQIERSISVLVYGGVLEKFPGLKIVSAENDVGWMPYFMYRLDTVQNRLGAVGGMKLPMRASEYIKRQVYATFISDPVFVDSLHRYGLPEEQRRKIAHDTAARVYGLE